MSTCLACLPVSPVHLSTVLTCLSVFQSHLSLTCLPSPVCQIINQTLSPTWNQCLVMDRLLLSGDLKLIQQEPPRIVIEVYDDDALVCITYIT